MGRTVLYQAYKEQLAFTYDHTRLLQGEQVSTQERKWLNQMDVRTSTLPDATLQALYPNITRLGPNGDKIYDFLSNHALYIAHLEENENSEEAKQKAVGAFVSETNAFRSVAGVWEAVMDGKSQYLKDINAHAVDPENTPEPTWFPFGVSYRIGTMCRLSDQLIRGGTNLGDNALFAILEGCCWVLNHQVYSYPFLAEVAEEHVERVNEFVERVSVLAAPARKDLNRT